MRRCPSCKKSFKPQFTDDELRELFYEEEVIENNENMQRQYPGYVQSLPVPAQVLCSDCSMSPEVTLQSNMFGGIRVVKKQGTKVKEDKAAAVLLPKKKEKKHWKFPKLGW